MDGDRRLEPRWASKIRHHRRACARLGVVVEDFHGVGSLRALGAIAVVLHPCHGVGASMARAPLLDWRKDALFLQKRRRGNDLGSDVAFGRMLLCEGSGE